MSLLAMSPTQREMGQKQVRGGVDHSRGLVLDVREKSSGVLKDRFLTSESDGSVPKNDGTGVRVRTWVDADDTVQVRSGGGGGCGER